jgi:phosphate transport system substrate-binding protein
MNGTSAPAGTVGPTSPTAATDEARPVVRRRRSRGPIYGAVVAVLVVIVLVGVGSSTNWYGLQKTSNLPACSSGITLQGDGAQVAVPLMGAWTPAYHNQSNNEINYPGSGSGTGLSHFTSGAIDFAMTDDPLTPAERSALPGPALTLPFAGGALTIIYNLPGLPGHLDLTAQIVAEIYNGNITSWNDSAIRAINPGVVLPAQTIYTVHRSDPAGTTYVLTDLLSQTSPYWATVYPKGIATKFPTAPLQTAVKGNSAVVSTVASNKYAIGYSDLTDVLEAATPPQYAAMQNPAGNYIAPTIQNTESAIVDKLQSMTSIPLSDGDWFNVSMVNANGSEDYPVATFLYMFVYQATDKGFAPSLAKSQVLIQWVSWTITKGQAFTDETAPTPLYYAPLPSAIVATDQAGLQTMSYNGASIPSCK